MEVSKEYISKLLGIIEEQKRINSDLVRIIQKQDLEIKQLKKESEKYRIAYESLLIEVKELRIKVLEIDNLKAENKALKAENRKLKLEIKKLKEELGKDSHNSSKPPSSNKFGNRHRNRNKKPKNKKKVGGQTGHKGNNLKKEAQADKKVIHVANKCSKCGYDLSEVENYESQIFFKKQSFLLRIAEENIAILNKFFSLVKSIGYESFKIKKSQCVKR